MDSNTTQFPNTESEYRPSAVKTLRRFFFVAWRVSPFGAIAQALLTLVHGFIPIGILWASRGLVNLITAILAKETEPSLETAAPWVVALVGLALFRNITGTYDGYLRWKMQNRIKVHQQHTLLEAATHIDFALFDQPQTYDLIQRARQALDHRLTNFLRFLTEIGQLCVTLVGYGVLLWIADPLLVLVLDEIVWWIFDSLQQLISAITLGIVLWRYHPLLALLPMITGFASWWSGSRFAASVYNLDVEQTPQRRERDALEGILMDRGAGKEIRLYQAQDLWITRWRKLWTALIDEQQVIERRKFFAHLAIDIARGLLYACSLILLLLEIFRGGLTVGTYIAAAAALVQLDGIWNEVTSHFQWIGNEMRRLSGDLYPFLDRGSDTIKAKTGGESPSEFHINPFQTSEEPPYLRIENVSFLYPNTQEPVLKHINLTLKKGESVALVGPNGAGKTTLGRVLLGLYRPQTGTIHVGDVPLNDENHRQWLTHCSAIFQDFTSYHLTARENIIFGDLEHPERMEAASIAGGAAPVVGRLTAGYETTLGPTFGGRDLSGGEWQRLATARSFMRESPWLVVLDEPTAALDPLAEQAVYERFIERSKGRTSVLISHRLSSVRTCDRILVIDNGTIVEDGDHESLLARDGLYAQFFRAQAQWYV